MGENKVTARHLEFKEEETGANEIINNAAFAYAASQQRL